LGCLNTGFLLSFFVCAATGGMLQRMKKNEKSKKRVEPLLPWSDALPELCRV